MQCNIILSAHRPDQACFVLETESIRFQQIAKFLSRIRQPDRLGADTQEMPLPSP